jgi:hypothetical protein
VDSAAGTGARFSFAAMMSDSTAGQGTNTAEIVAVDAVWHRADLGDAAQHDQRVAWAPAEALRARDERHQSRIVRASLLHRAPGEIVKRLEVVLRGCVERGLPAGRQIRACGALRRSEHQECWQNESDNHQSIL